MHYIANFFITFFTSLIFSLHFFITFFYLSPRSSWGRSVGQTVSPIRGCFGIILIFFNTAYRDEGIDQLRTKTTTINQTYPKTNTTTLLLTYRDKLICQLGSQRMMYWSRSGIVKYAFFSRKNHRFFRKTYGRTSV